jgi:hypothetical protein
MEKEFFWIRPDHATNKTPSKQIHVNCLNNRLEFHRELPALCKEFRLSAVNQHMARRLRRWREAAGRRSTVGTEATRLRGRRGVQRSCVTHGFEGSAVEREARSELRRSAVVKVGVRQGVRVVQVRGYAGHGNDVLRRGVGGRAPVEVSSIMNVQVTTSAFI